VTVTAKAFSIVRMKKAAEKIDRNPTGNLVPWAEKEEPE
jgi:hypothetical protein